MEKKKPLVEAGIKRSYGLVKKVGLKKSDKPSLKTSGTQAIKKIRLSQSEKLKKYHEMVELRRSKSQYQRCAACANIFSARMMQPHHPFKRQRMLTVQEIQNGPTARQMILDHNLKYDSLYEFILVCAPCHESIHNDEVLAKKRGLLL